MKEPEALICLETKKECTKEQTETIPNKSLSKTKLSDVEEVVSKNYGKYHELSKRYLGLQQWIIEQEKLQNVRQ